MVEKAIIYLWTRDGEFPVCQETEDYILGQIQTINNSDSQTFSDHGRAEMADRIIKRLGDCSLRDSCNLTADKCLLCMTWKT